MTPHGPNSKSDNITWHHGLVSPDDRAATFGHHGATVWFTGLSGSGKSTIAVEVEKRLVDRGVSAYRLDGDNVRHGLNADLGFSATDRAENIRRIGEVARLFADAGVVCLASFVSPYRADRDRVRAIHAASNLPFLEVFVDTPLAECERRDPKGLYEKARAGELKGLTGIDDPYEPPASPELRLETTGATPAEIAARVVAELESRSLI